jgi:hypothetical protein
VGQGPHKALHTLSQEQNRYKFPLKKSLKVFEGSARETTFAGFGLARNGGV